MQILTDYHQLKAQVQSIARRFDMQGADVQKVKNTVQQILQQVRLEGLNAVSRLSRQIDSFELKEPYISCEGEFTKLSQEQQEAISLASKRIRDFQIASLPAENTLQQAENKLSVISRPIGSVGVYIPGGQAPLLSTVLMTVIPAQVAGVKRLVLTSPPPVHRYVLGVADHLGIEEILQVGGAQAIASLAYGLEDINLEPVDKIVGPGNLFVTLAKKEVYGEVGIDGLYGPSELVIVADASANPLNIAHDLIAQLEHGSGMEASCLFTDSEQLAQEVSFHLEEIIPKQPHESAIRKSSQKYGLIGIVDKLEQAADLVNISAPEHLELKVQDPDKLLPLINNAGAIFLNGCNEALGDYLAGPSHCLPTGRAARFSGGLSVLDFLKRSSLVDIQARSELIQKTAILARMEGLEAHAQAAEKLL